MKPAVSVIMAAYNSIETITRSMFSVFSQAYTDWELIVVDDCSEDKTADLVSQYTAPNVTLIRKRRNFGPAGARNAGIRKAKGKFIAILDADDAMLPGRLHDQVRFMQGNPDVFLVGSGAYVTDENYRRTARQRAIRTSKIARCLPYFNPMVHVSIMFRNDGTLYDKTFRLCEDYEFYLRAVKAGKKLANMDKFLVEYMEHGYLESKKGAFMEAGKRAREINTAKVGKA